VALSAIALPKLAVALFLCSRGTFPPAGRYPYRKRGKTRKGKTMSEKYNVIGVDFCGSRTIIPVEGKEKADAQAELMLASNDFMMVFVKKADEEAK